ncbi:MULTISPECIES: anti-sigma factor domain-containing protein [unclassified Arthrobacter]|uniref:anti-sigma factor domain-containing protein n=1 Tax=unclassified Arthrobacter TaxID=235627 RepID=UPI001491FB6A|nr:MULTISPECIES: anti-sigma factor [unclassified Arthrobacter]MBE0009476.1 anti-sigma factor [Arthrobacter sp. AET 35A]NOJ60215.1 anti-sigma factor [Arthrobacter sp. 260]NOJ63475.1 anti-sigma factor [Arthrobacter sp. 147(2020)]
MQHLDPGTISMAALDEPLDADSQGHLDHCDTCAGEVRELNSVVLAARGDFAGAPLESPDPQVWAGIHQELGLQSALLPDPLSRTPQAAAPVPGHQPAETAESAATVVAFEPRHGRRTFTSRFLVAAVTAGVLTGAAAVWAAQQFGADSAPAVVAQSELDPLEGFTAQGSATVYADDDGARTLEITVTDNQVAGYQEVWLIAPDLQEMYSLGVVGAGTSSFTIPDSVDLAAFPIVDVSDEPLDGDPVHSGVSVLRGTLSASDS